MMNIILFDCETHKTRRIDSLANYNNKFKSFTKTLVFQIRIDSEDKLVHVKIAKFSY